MRQQRGFSLTEALIGITMLAVCVFAITMPFTATARIEQEDVRRSLAGMLASEMMEEILAKPFEDPQGGGAVGPESGESSRSNFDNIDDYDGYSESAGAIADMSGAVLTEPAATGLSRHVDVDYVYVSGQDTGDSPTFVRITVQMQYLGEEVLEITRLRYAYP